MDTLAGWDFDATTGFSLATAPAATATTFYYNYNSIFSAAATADTATLFTAVSVPGSYTNADITLMGKYKINITAQAIQSDNFVDAAAAFAQLPA
jgi:hypothetical protein